LRRRDVGGQRDIEEDEGGLRGLQDGAGSAEQIDAHDAGEVVTGEGLEGGVSVEAGDGVDRDDEGALVHQQQFVDEVLAAVGAHDGA
jgi:hypothetical protein